MCFCLLDFSVCLSLLIMFCRRCLSLTSKIFDLGIQRNGPTKIFTRGIERMVDYKLELDPETDRKMQEDPEFKPRKHLGIRRLKCINLPTRLERAAQRIISRCNSTLFRNEVEEMYFKIHFSALPKEPHEIRERSKELLYQLSQLDGIDIDLLDEDDKQTVLENRKKKLEKRLAHSINQWSPVTFEKKESVAYMAARLVPNYAVLLSVFNEIKQNDPSFRPQTLFDFGSGLGSTIWAANEIWPQRITEFFCVDISSDMNDLSQLLLNDGEEDKQGLLEGIFHRQFLPASSTVKFDMVVSAHSLLDLPDSKNRIHVVENLWHKTQDFLVIIERGTRAGFAAVLEARNFILQLAGHKVTETFHVDHDDTEVSRRTSDPSRAYVFAPCPHEFPCPRQFTTGPTLCNFSTTYDPLRIGQKQAITQREYYSYVVLRKGPNPFESHKIWPRIVQPNLRRSGHSICRLCCPDGRLHEVVFTKARHEKNLFQCAKVSKWGDLLPARMVKLKEDDKPEYGESVKYRNWRE